MRHRVAAAIGASESKCFVFVWAIQYIGFWVTANLAPSRLIYELGSSASTQIVKPPPKGNVPPVGSNSISGITTIATHPLLLHYTLQIFVTNTTLMLITSVPFFGLIYGEYIAVKLGALVNYYASYTAHNSNLSTLVISGALFTQPFYYFESFGFALACSAGLLGGVTLFRPTKRRLLWYVCSIGVSALLLLVAAFLEASFTLHYL